MPGVFNLDLSWTPTRRPPRRPKTSGAVLFTALQDQLGLRLRARRLPSVRWWWTMWNGSRRPTDGVRPVVAYCWFDAQTPDLDTRRGSLRAADRMFVVQRIQEGRGAAGAARRRARNPQARRGARARRTGETRS